MELFKGRPVDTAGREEREIEVYDCLDSLNIEYYRVDHEVAMTMDDCKAVDEVLGAVMCKNLFLCNRQKTKFYLLIMPAGKPFKTKELSSQIGSARLSFASGDKMLEYLNINPGAVSVMGLKNDTENDVSLIVDEDLLKDKYIGCHPCVNTSSLKIKTDDLVNVFLPFTKHTMSVVKLIGE